MGDMMGGEDDAEFMREMSGNSSSSSKPATESSATKPAAKPDPRASLTESQRQAEEAKDLGNEAYKKKKTAV